MKEIDHEFTKCVVCPHCGYEELESWEWGDDGERECSECEKRYAWDKQIDIKFSTSKL